jgi:hypothetical protein
MAGGLTPEQRYALIKAYGSIENAIDKAIERSPELGELWQSQHVFGAWPPGSGFWELWWKRALPILGVEIAVDPDLQDSDTVQAPGDQASGAVGAPGHIPEGIVERAVRLHVEEGYGRRRLDNAIPGLTEYQAGQVLGWLRVGKPAGLWLEDGRLKWGKAISTTPAGLRLPRL